MSAHRKPRLKKLALLAFALLNVQVSAQAVGLLPSKTILSMRRRKPSGKRPTA
jgi:hypothetical protein